MSAFCVTNLYFKPFNYIRYLALLYIIAQAAVFGKSSGATAVIFGKARGNIKWLCLAGLVLTDSDITVLHCCLKLTGILFPGKHYCVFL